MDRIGKYDFSDFEKKDVQFDLIFDRFSPKCHWQSILGQRWNFMDLTHHSANRCLRDPQGTFYSDNLLARHDGCFLNYPSCTMKYVVSATCRIKQHFKTKASQILQDFNPSVSVESRPAKPMDTVALNLCDPWCSATKYLYIFDISFIIVWI